VPEDDEGGLAVSFYEMLTMTHSAVSILFLALAMLSVAIAVMIAVKPAEDPANQGLVKKANIVSYIEISVAGLVALTGLTAMVLGGWPLSQMWLWLSLVIMLFYSTILKRVTKPARMVVAVGGSEIKSGMQVILHICHMLLIIVAYALMLLKPV
jgi:hypothetical protein